MPHDRKYAVTFYNSGVIQIEIVQVQDNSLTAMPIAADEITTSTAPMTDAQSRAFALNPMALGCTQPESMRLVVKDLNGTVLEDSNPGGAQDLDVVINLNPSRSSLATTTGQQNLAAPTALFELWTPAIAQRGNWAYSNTSSASASSVGGISRPSAAAVAMFRVRSNLVGCWNGISPGSAPRRMRSM